MILGRDDVVRKEGGVAKLERFLYCSEGSVIKLRFQAHVRAESFAPHERRPSQWPRT